MPSKLAADVLQHTVLLTRLMQKPHAAPLLALTRYSCSAALLLGNVQQAAQHAPQQQCNKQLHFMHSFESSSTIAKPALT
jgi:hypothetical protein